MRPVRKDLRNLDIRTPLFRSADLAPSYTSLYWQQIVFSALILLLMIGGLFLAILGAKIFQDEGNIFMAYADIGFYCFVIIIALGRSIRFPIRCKASAYIIELISVSLVITTGQFGAAFVFFPLGFVVAGILLETRPAIRFVVVNLLINVIISVLLMMGVLDEFPIAGLKETWWIIISNMLVVCTVIILVIHLMVRGLRMQAELISEKEEDLRSIFQSSNDAIIVTDPAGRIRQLNPLAERMLNVTPGKSMLGEPLEKYFCPLDSETRQPLAGVMESIRGDAGGDQKSEEQAKYGILVGSGGAEDRHVLFNVSSVLIHGNPCGAVVICHDITRQVEMKERKVVQQKMEAVGNLASGIAHDFNNMLSGMMGYAELIKTELARSERERGSQEAATLMEFADEILSSGLNAATLVRQMQDYSRSPDTSGSAIDLHQAVEQAVKLLGRSLDKRIIVQVELQAEHHTIRGDLARIESAVLNLAINARDAMPEGGVLTIRTEDLVIEDDDDLLAALRCASSRLKAGSYVMLSVIDTGEGIDAEVMSHVFEPFFTTKVRGKGTGLGLAMVYALMKAQDGGLCISSDIGKGTQVRLVFPFAAEPQVDQGHDGFDPIDPVGLNGLNEPKDQADQKNQTDQTDADYALSLSRGVVKRRSSDEGTYRGICIVVDDETSVVDVVSKALRDLGFVVMAASDGIEGVELFAPNAADVRLVMLDMNMPHQDGPDTLAKLLEIDPGVRVIIMTGYAEESKLARVRSCSAVRGLLQKPFKLHELKDMVLRAIAG